MFQRKFYQHDAKCNRKFQAILQTTFSFNGERLTDIQHSMSMVLDTRFRIFIHYDSLLQNATNIIPICDSYFIRKCDRILLQNASGFLLQHATVLLQNTRFIIKCDVYYKLRQYTHLNKVACLKTSNFIKKRLQHRSFSVNIAKCLRTYFLLEHLR